MSFTRTMPLLAPESLPAVSSPLKSGVPSDSMAIRRSRFVPTPTPCSGTASGARTAGVLAVVGVGSEVGVVVCVCASFDASDATCACAATFVATSGVLARISPAAANTVSGSRMSLRVFLTRTSFIRISLGASGALIRERESGHSRPVRTTWMPHDSKRAITLVPHM